MDLSRAVQPSSVPHEVYRDPNIPVVECSPDMYSVYNYNIFCKNFLLAQHPMYYSYYYGVICHSDIDAPWRFFGPKERLGDGRKCDQDHGTSANWLAAHGWGHYKNYPEHWPKKEILPLFYPGLFKGEGGYDRDVWENIKRQMGFCAYSTDPYIRTEWGRLNVLIYLYEKLGQLQVEAILHGWCPVIICELGHPGYEITCKSIFVDISASGLPVQLPGTYIPPPSLESVDLFLGADSYYSSLMNMLEPYDYSRELKLCVGTRAPQNEFRVYSFSNGPVVWPEDRVNLFEYFWHGGALTPKIPNLTLKRFWWDENNGTKQQMEKGKKRPSNDNLSKKKTNSSNFTTPQAIASRIKSNFKGKDALGTPSDLEVKGKVMNAAEMAKLFRAKQNAKKSLLKQ